MLKLIGNIGVVSFL